MIMTTTTSPQDDLWPEGLDALQASPNQHKLMFENEHVRVLDILIRPGERTPVHTHRWPGILYVLSWSQFVRYDDKGVVLRDTRKEAGSEVSPGVTWGAPLPPHSFENVGKQDFHVIGVELKEDPPSERTGS